MISRLLIANRGEIAVRVARTAHRMGIATVGVYSEPDRDALHVAVVDRAVALGGATPAESYLRIDAIVEAALVSGATAVHPGYGFLAENAACAQAVIDAGLTWVGPSPDTIALLGDKVAAKEAAAAAGVPTTAHFTATPGPPPADVPFPALVKAAAGGGGRGMRIVYDRSDLATAIEAASREAEAAFGDGTVFIEPYVERGRHIEVQIIGDAHGAVVHLGERECSIQRRNQKIIEEAPSIGIDDATRNQLCQSALDLARHVGYQNAGTVEYLVAPDGATTFLEVNTRLQVEHPVTEAVTGWDLVELQLRVASGQQLPMTQDQVIVSGHAIEARLVAEDPAAGWLPSSGPVHAFAFEDVVRVDTGVRAGSIVSPDYDSLLAKVIAHGPTREEAAARLVRALRTASIVGPSTNADTLTAILEESDFRKGATPTVYLDEHPEVSSAGRPSADDRQVLLIHAALAAERSARAADRRWGFAPSGWRNLRTQGQRQEWVDVATGTTHQVEYSFDQPGVGGVLIGDWPVPGADGSLRDDERSAVRVRVLAASAEESALEIDGIRHRATVVSRGAVSYVSSPAGRLAVRRAPRFVEHRAELVGEGPVAPLPGTVIAIDVSPGDTVEEGDRLLVLEAMKMEHTIAAPAAAVVEFVAVRVGDRVDVGDVLVHLVATE